MVLVWILALGHLALGIVAEASYWNLMPVWYHVVFLLPVVPATVAEDAWRRCAPDGLERHGDT